MSQYDTSSTGVGERAVRSSKPVADSPLPARAGIGLRFPHHREMIERRPQVPWLEVHAENYMSEGASRACLEALCGDYPISLHGVGLSLGSADALDRRHLGRLRDLAARLDPALVSEHLAWCSVDDTYLADLLPLPLTEEALEVVIRHVDEAQEALGRRILVENPSTYLRFTHSTIPEPEFLAAIAVRTGCGILCDVNNIFVSASNHGFDPERYLDALPPGAIGEYHLAGHALREFPGGRALRIDDHGSPVSEPVWALYAHALARIGPRPTLIEWDTNIPALDRLLAEAAIAQQAIDRAALARSAATHAVSIGAAYAFAS